MRKVNIHKNPSMWSLKIKTSTYIILYARVVWSGLANWKTSANHTFIHFLIFILYWGTLILIIKTEKNRKNRLFQCYKITCYLNTTSSIHYLAVETAKKLVKSLPQAKYWKVRSLSHLSHYLHAKLDLQLLHTNTYVCSYRHDLKMHASFLE